MINEPDSLGSPTAAGAMTPSCHQAVLFMFACLLGACAGHPSAPGFTTPEGAAVYAVLQYRAAPERRLVRLNIPPATQVTETGLRADLQSTVDSLEIWRAEDLYGGDRRHVVLTSKSYLVLDVRPLTSSGNDSVALRVAEERCPGWPCRASQLVVVRRHPLGFVPGRPRRLTVE
jgi:hypothetical protein